MVDIGKHEHETHECEERYINFHLLVLLDDGTGKNCFYALWATFFALYGSGPFELHIYLLI